MGWQDLLSEKAETVLPWLGGRKVHSADRTWTIKGRTPLEVGWYRFATTGGREATLMGKANLDPNYGQGLPCVKGYLVGERLISDQARVDPDPLKLVDQTEMVWCPEEGLDRFQRVRVLRDREGRLVYMDQEWPLGPEQEALEAYQDRKETLVGVKGVTPALDLAFRWLTYQRRLSEERDLERARIRAAEEARLAREAEVKRLMGELGNAVGRRALAQVDFKAAAKAALQVSGAELLDVLNTGDPHEKRVQYRFRLRRLECVVDTRTLGIIEAGVCLEDHQGTKGDTFFTLESLPGVIGEAIDLDRLVIRRHI